MDGIAYEVWDVFTDRAFGGNPLAVLLDARGLSTAQMQAITREFGFSETTFVLPPETAEGTARVRIFDPAHELPFAGHPTIGTAACLAARGAVFGAPVGEALRLEEAVGIIACSAQAVDGSWSAQFVTDAPFATLHEISAADIAACLTLPVGAIRDVTHPPVMASKGLPFVIVELADADALAASRPDRAAMTRADASYPSGADHFAILAYTRHAPDRVDARMFAPLSGIEEDPATGSAAAALAALLCHVDRAQVRLTITQGVQMGRPSEIEAEAWTEPGGHIPVRIGGKAVRVMRGELERAALAGTPFEVEPRAHIP